MQFSMVESGGVLIRHDNQELYWDVSVFDRTRLRDLIDTFRDINGFIERIPAVDQTRLYNVYFDIRNTLDEVPSITQLTARLIEYVKQIYEIISYEALDQYMHIYADISYPDNIRTEYDVDDPSPSRTYLRSDYRKLVVLTAMLRPMVPIFGEYIKDVKDEVGSLYKEYVAMRLLRESAVMQTEPMHRLMEYIGAYNAAAALGASHVLAGLGTEDIPDWLIAMVVIRRISVGEIDATEARGSVISNIYGFITNTLQDLDKKFGGVKDKQPTTHELIEGESNLEGYKLKQVFTAADEATFVYFADDLQGLVLSIEPNISLALLEICAKERATLLESKIYPHHTVLCQWILAKSLPAQAIDCLPKRSMVNCLIAVRCILLTWGFTELAMLATARAAPDNISSAHIPEPKGRIPPALIAELNRLYPHMLGDIGNNRRGNVAYMAINGMCKYISATKWVVTLPKGTSAEDRARYTTYQGVMQLPQNLAEQIAELVVRINVPAV